MKGLILLAISLSSFAAFSSSFDKALEQYSVTCEKENDCPESLVRVMVGIEKEDGSYRVGGCTGFLISEDIVVTNAHCVPPKEPPY